MSTDFFQFKQFKVYHDKCAMKVGTDGVLIGAWCSCESRKKVLDIGAGTGVISLMIAQRESSAIIDAVEIDKDAALQAKENFNHSQWSDRLNIVNDTFQNFANKTEHKYDLIVSNPPYFLNSLKNPEIKRQMARHAELLPYEDIINGVVHLLNTNGLFSAIFPYEEANIFVVKAAIKGLYCIRRVDIKGSPKKQTKRVLVEFSMTRKDIVQNEMIIENNGRHTYSDKYIELTKEFYLKF